MKKCVVVLLFLGLQVQAAEYFPLGTYEGVGRYNESNGKTSLRYSVKLTIGEHSLKAVYKSPDRNGVILQTKEVYHVTRQKGGFFTVRETVTQKRGRGACLDHVCQISFDRDRYGIADYNTFTFKGNDLIRSGSIFRPSTSPNPNLIFTEMLSRRQ